VRHLAGQDVAAALEDLALAHRAEPLPPQADGRKIFWLLSAISRLLPTVDVRRLARVVVDEQLDLALLTSLLLTEHQHQHQEHDDSR
jgi:hypothetical protein